MHLHYVHIIYQLLCALMIPILYHQIFHLHDNNPLVEGLSAVECMKTPGAEILYMVAYGKLHLNNIDCRQDLPVSKQSQVLGTKSRKSAGEGLRPRLRRIACLMTLDRAEHRSQRMLDISLNAAELSEELSGRHCSPSSFDLWTHACHAQWRGEGTPACHHYSACNVSEQFWLAMCPAYRIIDGQACFWAPSRRRSPTSHLGHKF